MSVQNPASWVEIHPPDLISVLGNQVAFPKKESVVAVAVVADHCGVGTCQWEAIDIEIPAPPAGWFQGAKVSVTEFVGLGEGETNADTIEEGNDSKTGARIDILEDRARIRVGSGGSRSSGRRASSRRCIGCGGCPAERGHSVAGSFPAPPLTAPALPWQTASAARPDSPTALQPPHDAPLRLQPPWRPPATRRPRRVPHQ